MPYFSANSGLSGLCGFRIDQGESRLLGRNTESAPTEEQPITLECVSRRHARLSCDDKGVSIEDVGSTNGTFVNGDKISFRILEYGDRISLGDPNLTQFTLWESEKAAKSELVQRTFNARDGDKLTIGRGQTCDIILDDETTASASHASIYLNKGGCWIEDLRSTNGTWVNGNRIKTSPVLPEDIVFVGSSMIRMERNENGELKVEVSKWNSSIQLDCVALNKVVGKDLEILKGVDLSISPGEFVGILGPSGAGKSTLLKALNGFSPPSSGAVLVNDLALFKSYALCKNLIGYVPQDDVLHEQLTVERTLRYSARLRLPRDQSDLEINRIVEEVLVSLRLKHVAGSRISKLSGGQRKRVSVGVELITNPALLFLDEPTSGLDPSTEEKLMHHLRDMSRSGTTILITTHILYNLKLLDKVIFMARGRVVFYGTPEEALEFFSEQGVPIDNPIKIFDLLEGIEQSSEITVESKQEVDSIAASYAGRFKNSALFQKYVYKAYSKFARTLSKHSVSKSGDDNEETSHETLLASPLPPKKIRPSKLIPTFTELAILNKRNFSIKLSSIRRLQIYLVVPLILGLITLSTSNPGYPNVADLEREQYSLSQQLGSPGSAYDEKLKQILSPNPIFEQRSGQEIVYQLKHETVANLPISLSTLLILTMTAVFCGTLIACLELSSEKSIYLRERMAGQKTVNYLLSKIPFLFLLAASQMLILVVVCSFDESLRAVNPLALGGALIAICWVAVCLGLMVSSLDPSDGQYSVVIAIAVILPQLVLSGALGPDYFAGMSEITQAIANLLPAKWGMEIILSSAFADHSGLGWVKDFAEGEMGLNFDAAVYFRAFIAYLLQVIFYLSVTFYVLERRTPLG